MTRIIPRISSSVPQSFGTEDAFRKDDDSILGILILFAEFNILSYKEDRKIGFTLIFALICAVAIYALFKYAFSMPLPQGILKGIF